jgi:hypothetical protein
MNVKDEQLISDAKVDLLIKIRTKMAIYYHTHVLHSAADGAGALALVHNLCQAEINESDAVCRVVVQDVLQLQVPEDDAASMNE